MSDALRTRIAAVLEEHRQVASSCECGFDLGVSAITWRWRDHVADAVIAELQPELTRHDTGCVCNECWVNW